MDKVLLEAVQLESDLLQLERMRLQGSRHQVPAMGRQRQLSDKRAPFDSVQDQREMAPRNSVWKRGRSRRGKGLYAGRRMGFSRK